MSKVVDLNEYREKDNNNVWIRYKSGVTQSYIDRFFENDTKLRYYMHKHRIKKDDIVFLKRRKGIKNE